MKHFLITRFNLKLEKWKTAKDGSKVLTDEWLHQRFKLFEEYCLPSVLNQSSLDFEWLIFFDIDTPTYYQQRISELTDSHEHIRVVYTDGFKGLIPSLRHEIKSKLIQDDEFIITTRLDNDDAIHRDFIKTIQDLSIKEHETVIDLQKGYQMNILNDRYEVREYVFPFNQFVSLVESGNSFNTVLSKMHLKWGEVPSIRINKKTPFWIEIIHERNKSNDTKKHLPYLNRIKLRDFGIDYDYIPMSFMRTVLLNCFEVYPYKTIRLLYRWIKKILKW